MLLFNLLWFANKYDKVTTACSKWLKIEKEKEKKKRLSYHTMWQILIGFDIDIVIRNPITIYM